MRKPGGVVQCADSTLMVAHPGLFALCVLGCAGRQSIMWGTELLDGERVMRTVYISTITGGWSVETTWN